MRHLIGIEYTKIVEFVVVIAGHFPDQRTFSVDHLVVAQRQDKVLRKCVGHGERQRVVVTLAVQGVQRHILQHIVHPAHVPLKEEPEPAVVIRLRNERERRRLLGNHHDRRFRLERRGVELPQKVDCLQVLPPAEAVRLVVRAVIVQIQHRRHRVDPDAVGVELRDPVAGVGDQKRPDLGLAVVINARCPVRVLVHCGVRQLVTARAVELIKPVGILRKMRRHPVENHANSRPMRLVDEILEVLRRAVAMCRRVIAGDLIAPRRVIRILHHRQQFNMRIAHVPYIGNQLLRKLAEGQDASILVPLPGPRMHLVNIDRTV